MKVGDLVKKRWGRIEPDEVGSVGLLIKLHRNTDDHLHVRGWDMITVLYSFGERVFNKDNVEVVNESR